MPERIAIEVRKLRKVFKAKHKEAGFLVGSGLVE